MLVNYDCVINLARDQSATRKTNLTYSNICLSDQCSLVEELRATRQLQMSAADTGLYSLVVGVVISNRCPPLFSIIWCALTWESICLLLMQSRFAFPLQIATICSLSHTVWHRRVLSVYLLLNWKLTVARLTHVDLMSHKLSGSFGQILFLK